MAQRDRSRHLVNVLPTRAGGSRKRFLQISFVKLKISIHSPACLPSPISIPYGISIMKNRPLAALLVIFCLLVFAPLAIAQTLPTPEPVAKPSPSVPPANYDLRWAVKIPMRDKVELNATLYLPKSGNTTPGRTPVIFSLSPYISDSYPARAAYFAAHGYAFALVDVRGRGNSGGEFEPFANEAQDGYDIVEWFAKQPFCDGKVTMWGGS